MAEQKLRVGFVGVGMFAIYFHAPQLRATRRAEITAICRRSPERLAIARDALQVDAVYSAAEVRIVTIEPGPQY